MSFPIYLLQSIAFLDLLAVGLIVPLTPSHVRSLGANHIEVGLLGSIYAIFQLGSGPLIGSFSDLQGRKSILILTLVVCSVAYTLTGFIRSVIGILCLRAVLGLFKQTQLLTRAMVPEYEHSERKQSEIFGKMAAISGVGITVGPVIGGHVIESYPNNGFAYICIAVGACFLINTGLTYLLPKICSAGPKRRDRSKKRKKTDGAQPKQSLLGYIYFSLKQSVADLYSINWASYWDVFMLKALIALAMGIYYTNYSLYLKTTYDLTPKYIGYVISLQGSVGSLSSYCISYINKIYQDDEDYSLRNLHVFVLLSISLGGLILSQNVYVYIFWLIPLAVGNAVGRLSSLERTLKRSRGSHCGSLIGASNSVRSLAGIIAPIVTGLITQYYGVSYPLYVCFLAMLLGLCMSYYSKYYTKDEEDYSTSDEYECDYRYDKLKTE